MLKDGFVSVSQLSGVIRRGYARRITPKTSQKQIVLQQLLYYRLFRANSGCLASNVLTVWQLNESLVRGLACGWQLKKRVEQGIIIRELEKEMHMTKRTITRYVNLCYLSPRIVADILEYKNPANLTLRELMNLADSQMDFEKQEMAWSQ